MDNNHSPPPTKPSLKTDNFKLINGICPVIERRLYDAGILTFTQLATMPPGSVVPLVPGLAIRSADIITQQNWINQAHELASTLTPTKSEHNAIRSGTRQHYAMFTIELLLDEGNNVHRARVTHIQDKEEDIWVDWEETHLMNFIDRHAALPQSVSEPTHQVPAIAESLPPVAASVEPVSSVLASAESVLFPIIPVSLGGMLRLPRLETMLANVDNPHSSNILHHDQPFNVRLTLDLAEVVAPSNVALNYTATVYAKGLNGGLRQIVGETYGTTTAENELVITMENLSVPQGIYRLEAVATLTLPPVKRGLIAHLEGGILQIH